MIRRRWPSQLRSFGMIEQRGVSAMRDNAATIVVYVDADACPVKAEVYRVAERHGVRVYVVANSFIGVPQHPLIERVLVGSGFDAADDWIAERARRGAIVVTADVPLASRCIK